MSCRRPIVLVTGAEGFVGRHIVPALLANGWSVRRVVRKPTGREDEVVIGSIGPKTDWQRALVGVEAIVHLAARVHHSNEEDAVELYSDVNLHGTLNLARSAEIAGVDRFIFVSTMLVHGRSNHGRAPFNERDILAPRGVYGESKAAAEAELATLARGSSMKISVIRPPLVYGAGAKGNFAKLRRAVELGLPLPFSGVYNERAFLSVQNLVSFISWLLAIRIPANHFEVFLVADNEQVSTPEFIARLAKAMNKRPRLFYLSPRVLDKLFWAMGRRTLSDSLLGSSKVDLSKAISMGWRPTLSLDEGLRLIFSNKESPI